MHGWEPENDLVRVEIPFHPAPAAIVHDRVEIPRLSDVIRFQLGENPGRVDGPPDLKLPVGPTGPQSGRVPCPGVDVVVASGGRVVDDRLHCTEEDRAERIAQSGLSFHPGIRVVLSHVDGLHAEVEQGVSRAAR